MDDRKPEDVNPRDPFGAAGADRGPFSSSGPFPGGGYGGRDFGSSGGPGARFLDDLARLMTDAAGIAQGARREVETVVRSQGERFAQQLDLVQRDEFEAVREMAAQARMENESLRAELDELKASMAAKEKGAAKPKTARADKKTD